jgi:hypothetical protein
MTSGCDQNKKGYDQLLKHCCRSSIVFHQSNVDGIKTKTNENENIKYNSQLVINKQHKTKNNCQTTNDKGHLLQDHNRFKHDQHASRPS